MAAQKVEIIAGESEFDSMLVFQAGHKMADVISDTGFTIVEHRSGIK
jgi:hypothetical protein